VANPERGEIWWADLGAAAKIRPVLVVSVPFGDRDYALLQVVPHTTQRRGSQFEVELPMRFLEGGVFNIQGMLAVPAAKFVKPIGMISPSQMQDIERAMKRWLGLQPQ
jgi:mRNA interferase MazF